MDNPEVHGEQYGRDYYPYTHASYDVDDAEDSEETHCGVHGDELTDEGECESCNLEAIGEQNAELRVEP